MIPRGSHDGSRDGSRTVAILVLAVASCLSRPGACEAAGRPLASHPSILLITVDTLRPDHLGLYGYARATSPQLERWFGGASIFERAYAPAAYTSPSVVSILTGLLPQHHRVRLFLQKIPPGLVTVPARLAARGYQTAAIVSNPVLTRDAIGLDSQFQYYDDFVNEPEPYRNSFQRGAAGTTDAAIYWLTRVRKAGSPHFLWIHYMDPHGPYTPPASTLGAFFHSGTRPIPASRIPRYQRHPGLTDGLEYVDLYDEEIAYTDREIGRFLESYAALGFLDSALVIFAADHGERLLEERASSPLFFVHGDDPFEEEIRVPLALRGPGVPAGRVRAMVSLLALAPTILAAAGDTGAAGLDAAALAFPPREEPVVCEARGALHWKCVIDRRRKWMVALDPTDGHAVHRWVFDLERDPSESRDLGWDEQVGPASFLSALVRDDPDTGGTPRRYIAGRAPVAALHAPYRYAPGSDSSLVRTLRSLGYVH